MALRTGPAAHLSSAASCLCWRACRQLHFTAKAYSDAAPRSFAKTQQHKEGAEEWFNSLQLQKRGKSVKPCPTQVNIELFGAGWRICAYFMILASLSRWILHMWHYDHFRMLLGKKSTKCGCLTVRKWRPVSWVKCSNCRYAALKRSCSWSAPEESRCMCFSTTFCSWYNPTTLLTVSL